MDAFTLDHQRARESLLEFIAIYRQRPIRNNAGGMGLNHSFATWFILRQMQPSLVVESGVWRGHSTWLIEQAVPSAEIVAIDPRPERRLYSSPHARYTTADFTQIDWSHSDVADAVCFFDDHQNAYSRMKEMAWLGFRHAIFEDNYPCGEGDFYSLRHLRSGVGHPHLQMSPAYAYRPREAAKRWFLEPLLHWCGAGQHLVVPPNLSDRANLERHLAKYLEFPAVMLAATNNWGGPWEGAFEPVPPLFAREDSAVVALLGDSHGLDLSYGYLAYVALREQAAGPSGFENS